MHLPGLGAGTGPGTVAAFDPSATALVVADDRSVRVADLASRQVSTLDVDHKNIVDVALSPDRTKVAAGYRDGLIRIWRARLRPRPIVAGHPLLSAHR